MMCDVCKKEPLEMREINKALNERDEEIAICDDCFMKLRKK